LFITFKYVDVNLIYLGVCLQGSNGHGKTGKVIEFLNGYFQAWKSPWKIKEIRKVLENS